MDARFRMKILKLKHGFEAERQKIRMDKDLYIEKIGKSSKMTKEIGKKLIHWLFNKNMLIFMYYEL